jgi:glycosyltransferase involved in cell wall biosynthesis
MKKILFFGIYDPAYARTRVLKNGFERNGWQVDECRADPRVYRGGRKFLRLWRLGRQAKKEKYDLVLVCFPGQSVVWLARILFGRAIIFDAFLSLYDSNVFDRKIYGPFSLRGIKDKLLDTWSCRFARKVLLETNQHIEYFVKTFGTPREKFARIWISADDTTFSPRSLVEPEKFTVHFHGTFIPLQGISYIVKAADILRTEDIQFHLVGSGQEYESIRKKVYDLGLENMIEFTGKVPVEKIPGCMAAAHIVLGIFGDTEKTNRVIPNKVYEAMAMGKAIITADTPAVAELEGTKSALALVPVANGQAIANAILDLKNNPAKRAQLGKAARALFEKELLPEHMVAELLKDICGGEK